MKVSFGLPSAKEAVTERLSALNVVMIDLAVPRDVRSTLKLIGSVNGATLIAAICCAERPASATALAQSAAAESVFYQPLNRDSSLGPQQWQQIWQQTRARGFEAVIVQWSAYGDERFEQHDWLLASLAEAHRQGLTLVIGLQYLPWAGALRPSPPAAGAGS